MHRIHVLGPERGLQLASKVKSPAKLRFTAGSEAGDIGRVNFESVSNRGIGQTVEIFTVGGGWTISATGTSKEDFQGILPSSFATSIRELKIAAAKDGALTGSGTMTISGSVSTGFCTGQIDQTLKITATGSLVGTGPSAVLRLRLSTPATPGATVKMVCSGIPNVDLPAGGYADRYGVALGEFELPAVGGTKVIDQKASLGGVMNVTATGNFTVVRPKR